MLAYKSCTMHEQKPYACVTAIRGCTSLEHVMKRDFCQKQGVNTMVLLNTAYALLAHKHAGSTAAFFKIAAASLVQACAAPAQVANASLDEGCRQPHSCLPQPGEVLGTRLPPVLRPLRLSLTHPLVDLMPQCEIAHIQSRTAPGDVESTDLGCTLCSDRCPPSDW